MANGQPPKGNDLGYVKRPSRWTVRREALNGVIVCVGLCVGAGWPLAEPHNLTGIGGWAGWKEGGGGGSACLDIVYAAWVAWG